MKHSGTTAPFRGPHGEPLPNSVAEVQYLRLGGVDQWVMIRGERQSNPALILLHGGPGFTETQFFRRFNAPLEKAFTLVYWDQRGAGKSFDRTIPKSSMTVEQFISDLNELVEWVRKRLGHKKVVIFGHSWGSVLGVLYVARFPEKVSLYIGCAQVGDWAAGEAASYQYALEEARRQNHVKALSELRSIGPPPYSATSVMAERKWVQRLSGELSPRALWNIGRMFLGCPEWSILDVANVVRGFRFTLDALWTEVSTLNMMKLVPVLEVPTYFFAGRRDHWVPPETSAAYFEVLKAPAKQFIWFDESGHEPFVDESARFNRTMIERVRPRVETAPASDLRAAG